MVVLNPASHNLTCLRMTASVEQLSIVSIHKNLPQLKPNIDKTLNSNTSKIKKAIFK